MTLSLIHPEMSYKKYLEEWLKVKEHDFATSTLDRYKNRIETYINSTIGDFAVEEIDTHVLEDFVDYLEKRNPTKVKPLQEVHTIVRKTLGNAVEEGIILENPAEHVEITIKQQDKEMVILEGEQLDTYLKLLTKHKPFIALYLIIEEGLQPGEALALHWNDINFESRMISIKSTLSYDNKEVVNKSQLDDETVIRKIKVKESTISYLKMGKERQGTLNENPLGLVFPTRTGTPVIIKNLNRTHKTIAEKMGIKKTNLKDLENSYVLRAIKRGVNPVTLTEHLGYPHTGYLEKFEALLTRKQKRTINKASKKRYRRSLFEKNA
ncbi:phage integrase SAM-like domain-containing protein [Priestia filamentosa]|uniref:tyrosine-type recombinase/integrase n=1 Tax=Priestia filamentosa TaxID=1402861 RepID=UPI0005893441